MTGHYIWREVKRILHGFRARQAVRVQICRPSRRYGQNGVLQPYDLPVNRGEASVRESVRKLITDYARRGSRRISYAIIARILLRHAIRLRGMSAHPRMRTTQFLKEAVAQGAASCQAAKVRDR